jgi:hypothetical protein
MIQHFGPVRSTMLTAVVPGLSAMAAVLVLGEPLPWNLAAGLMLVTLGIVFGVRKPALSVPHATIDASADVSTVAPVVAPNSGAGGADSMPAKA